MPMKICGCKPCKRSRLEWRKQPHPSGKTHSFGKPLEGPTGLAKVCVECTGFLCWSHSEHTNLALELYRRPDQPLRPSCRKTQ